MEPDNDSETITVAASHQQTGGTVESDPSVKLSCWCISCKSFKFEIENTWKGLGKRYVFHTTGGDDTTAIIEEAMSLTGDILNGTKELKGCRLMYLRCTNCEARLGLHCIKGTRDKRYKNIAMLRHNMVALGKSINAPQQDFNIVSSIRANEFDASREEDGHTKASQPEEQSSLNTIPIRQKDSEHVSVHDDAESSSKYTGAPCVTCTQRHTKCDRKAPNCSACVSSRRSCIWGKALQETAPPNSHATEPAAKIPAGASDEQNFSIVACGMCRMHHKSCDRKLPICSYCIRNSQKCKYNLKNANAIDQLDPKTSFGPESSTPVFSGDDGIARSSSRHEDKYGASDEGCEDDDDEEEEEEDDDDDEDDGVQPILPRVYKPTSEAKYELSIVNNLRKIVAEQRAIIENQQKSIDSLSQSTRRFQVESKENKEQMAKLMYRIQTVENELRRKWEPSNQRNAESLSNIENPRAKAPTQQSAPARRGGHSLSGILNGSAQVTPAKRSLYNVAELQIHDYEQKDSRPSSTKEDMRKGDSNAITEDAFVVDRSLYDATPPAETRSVENEMDIDRPRSQRSGHANYDDRHPSGKASRAESPEVDQHIDEETQEYLRQHVRDEDPDDDDFTPGAEVRNSPSDSYEPSTQNLAFSVENLLPQSRPLDDPSSARRGKMGPPRGRPRSRLSSGSLQRAVVTNATQNSFIPSTPPISSAASNRTPVRRGVSGGGMRPVPTEFSHSAFSSSQAATMISDPSPKRQKLAPTQGPVSYALTPTTGEKPSARYPNGRIRDEDGYLLNNNGQRDRRSIRGKMLGNKAFKKSEGPRRTVETLMAQDGDNEPAPSPKFFDPTEQFLPIQYDPAPRAKELTDQHRPAQVVSNSIRPDNASMETSKPAAPTPQAVAANKPDIGALAAQAEQERLAEAHEKGNNERYSEKHYKMMKMLQLGTFS